MLHHATMSVQLTFVVKRGRRRVTWCSEKAGMAGAGARRWVGTQGDDVTGRPDDPEFEESTWVKVWG